MFKVNNSLFIKLTSSWHRFYSSLQRNTWNYVQKTSFEILALKQNCQSFFAVFIRRFKMLQLFLFLSISSVFTIIPVKNDDCTYEFDMDNNLIFVSCSKNVTLTIKEKEGAISFIQDPDSNLWFESDGNNKDHQSDRFQSKSTKKLKDAARLLKKMKSKMDTRLETLDNITISLSTGDTSLRTDLTNIQQIAPSSVMMREAMVAALQNQYTYLQHAMLAQNAEMKEMINMMTSLASAAQKSVRSQLAMNDKIQEDMLLILASLAKANVTKIERKSGK
jgi:hypothetical protein